ncbi:MAG: putative metal homeostasis protein [Leuconostoc citreum]
MVLAHYKTRLSLLSSAYRRLKSPNAKTRDRALKLIKEYKQRKQLKN